MSYFQSFIVVFIIGVFTSSVLGDSLSDKESKEKMQKVHNTCIEQSGTTEEVIQKARNGEFDDSDNKFKCYSKCIMLNMGSMRENGAVDVETFTKNIPKDRKEQVKKMFSNCSDFKEEDLCKRAYKIFKCTYEADPEHYFVI